MRLVGLALLWVGCVAKAPQSPAPEPMEEADMEVVPQPGINPDDMAPVPFMAEEIRAAFVPGLRIGWRTTQADKTSYSRWDVLASSPTEMTLRYTETDEDGVQLSDPVERVTPWEELPKHATFPSNRTTLAPGNWVGSIGSLQDCTVYTVQPGEGEQGVKTLWFCREHPGPPVRMTQTVDGQVVFELLMLNRELVAGEESVE